MSSVVIGRITFAPWTLNGNKEEQWNRIQDMLRKGDYTKEKDSAKYKSYWAFGNYQPVKSDENEIVHFGRLCHIQKEVEKNFYNDRTKGIFKEHLKNNSEFFSNFIVYPTRSVIIFEDKPPGITFDKFIDIFTRIYKENYGDDLSYVRIELFVETDAIYKSIKKYKKITKVELNVMPTNPDHDPIFKPLDDMLRAINPSKSKLNFENTEKGLIIENTLIEQAMYLGDAGYGQYRITGTMDINGEESDHTIDSSEKIKKIRTEYSINTVDIALEYLKIFKNYYNHWLNERHKAK